MISLLANIDVRDLAAAIEFYREALGLHLGRRLSDGTVAERKPFAGRARRGPRWRATSRLIPGAAWRR
jgi:catechol 2,3-dioxygenase-like lactoylglutathione lyase family enzyme